jgi:CBS-domain-containing membrane protein
VTTEEAEMRTWHVADVMTTDVAAVGKNTTYRAIVGLLAGRHVSAVPVVDRFRRVVGIVSETDLLPKVELAGEPHERQLFEGGRRRITRMKAGGAVAGELMTAPAVTTHPQVSVVAAAKLMDREQVNHLPVVDERGRLAGIVARSDLLKVHLRSDADIRRDVVDGVLRRVLAVPAGAVQVEVRDGVVTLSGQLERRRAVDVAALLAGQVSGVVDVINLLGCDRDDYPRPARTSRR